MTDAVQSQPDSRTCFICGAKIGEEDKYCRECGQRIDTGWKLRALEGVLAVVLLSAIGMVGAGISLWFLGDVWLRFAESRMVQYLSVGLMAGGTCVFFGTAVTLGYFVERGD